MAANPEKKAYVLHGHPIFFTRVRPLTRFVVSQKSQPACVDEILFARQVTESVRRDQVWGIGTAYKSHSTMFDT
jgi:hypothetical protein